MLTGEKDAAKELADTFAGFRKAAYEERTKATADLFNTKVGSADIFSMTKAAIESHKNSKGLAIARGSTVMSKYPDLLRRGPADSRIANYSGFKDKYELGRVGSDPATRTIIRKADKQEVGLLLLGVKSFAPLDKSAKPTTTGSAPAEGSSGDKATGTEPEPEVESPSRKLFHRTEDESGEATHVADDAGVPTRKYAYFETSRQQLMAGMADGATQKGRFVRFREAMNLPADMHTVDQSDHFVRDIYKILGDKVPTDVMANIHQYLGSGINQRGLSLTSTPRPEVYSNEGYKFASEDGVRIKVDLSLVPPEVILLNHYANEGVGSRLAASKAVPAAMLTKPKALPGGPRPQGYNYANSVVKNRELLLQELRPEWIVEITDHLKDRTSPKGKAPGAQPGPAAAGGPDSASLRKSLGFEHYERGRADGQQGKDSPDKLAGFELACYQLGRNVGMQEAAGKKAAKGDHAAFWEGFEAACDRKPLTTRTEVAKIGFDSVRQLSYDQCAALRKSRSPWFTVSQLHKAGPDAFEPKRYDSFWLAWAAEFALPKTAITTPPPVPSGAGTEPEGTKPAPPEKPASTPPAVAPVKSAAPVASDPVKSPASTDGTGKPSG